MEGATSECGRDVVLRRLTIGRRISEYISKSHNARVRYNAYDCFIKLIERNSHDFPEVWAHRMRTPRKKREVEEFVGMLRVPSVPKRETDELALRLLWLLDQMERQKRAGAAEKPVARQMAVPNRARA